MSARIMSAAFSAIMIVGALVLDEISRGMIEASTTRKPSIPFRRRRVSTTAAASLPIRQVSKMGVTGYLIGLTIGDVNYTGAVTGEVSKGTGVLTIKNLPASVLTGDDVNKSLTVTCNIQMDLSVLGEINTSARMCIWNK